MWSIIPILLGVFFLLAPAIAWKFGWGWAAKKEMPRWYAVILRIVGIAVVGLGVFFLIIEINVTTFSPAPFAVVSVRPAEKPVPAPTQTPQTAPTQTSMVSPETASNNPFDENGFLFADSSERYLTPDEIWNRINEVLETTPTAYHSEELLGFARNEIFARNGNVFDAPKYASHYSQYSWYLSMEDLHKVQYDELNGYETSNIALILKCEEEEKNQGPASAVSASTGQQNNNGEEQRQRRIAEIEREMQRLNEEAAAAQAVLKHTGPSSNPVSTPLNAP